jgi:hypothetical protein
MKTYFAMMLLVAASAVGAVACVGAPEEGVESSAAPVTAAPAAAEGDALKVKDVEVGFLSEEEARAEMHKSNASYAACTAAELANCRRQDPYGSGCMIRDGKVVCLFE